MRSVTAAQYRAALAKKAPAKPRRKQRSDESKLVRSLLAYLETLDGVAWRQQAGMILAEYRGTRRAIRVGKKGLPDVFFLRRGVLYGFECKRVGAKLRPAQEAMRKKLAAAGAVVVRVESIRDVRVTLGEKARVA